MEARPSPERPGWTAPTGAPPSPPSSGRLAGARLGPYVITGSLGEGGMGVVYAAHHTELDRPAALKILRRGGTPHARARLRREAQTIARLDHPGIVRVYDVGETPDGLPYIAMELVAGTDLGTILDRGAISLDDRLRAVAEAARALHFAHERQVIHRDVKPANLLLTADGLVKVLDFGIGKQLDGDTVTRLTATGVLLGTIAYMAPEQVRDDATADARTDVYALGATLYEAVSRRPPIDDDNPARAVYAILSQTPPPPSTVAPAGTFDAPDAPSASAVDAVCARALAKDPDDRYESAEALADEIDRIRAGKPPRTTTILRPRRRRRPVGALLGALLIAAASFGGGTVFGRLTAPAGEVAVDPGDGRDGAVGPTPSPPPPPPLAPDPAANATTTADQQEAADAAQLAALLPDLEAAAAQSNFLELLAVYRRLDAAGDFDRLERVLETIDTRRRIILILTAVLHASGSVDEAGLERAKEILDRNIVIATAEANAPKGLPAAAQAYHAAGRVVLGIISEVLEGDPVRGREWLTDPARHPNIMVGIPTGGESIARSLVFASLGAHGAGALLIVVEARLVAALAIRGSDAPVSRMPVADPDRYLTDPRALVDLVADYESRIDRAKVSPPLLARIDASLARLAERANRIAGGTVLLDGDGITRVALRAEPPSAWDVTDEGHLTVSLRPEVNAPWSAAEVHLDIGRFPERFTAIEIEAVGADASPMLAFEMIWSGDRSSSVIILDDDVRNSPASIPKGFFDGAWSLASRLRSGAVPAAVGGRRTYALRISGDRRRVSFLVDGETKFAPELALGPGEVDGWDLRIYVPPPTAVATIRLQRRD